MDANQTHYHLLLGRGDWSSCTEGGAPLSELWSSGAGASTSSSSSSSSSTASPAPAAVQWNDDRQDLTLAAQLYRFLPTDAAHTPDGRRGAARDRYGNWYWIGDDGQTILVRWSEAQGPVEYWPVADRPVRAKPAGAFGPKAPVAPNPGPLAGLTVTEHHYLVVGTVSPPGLLIFDLHAAGAPRQLLWPPGVAFVPFDIAAAPGGGVFILDRVSARYWALDHHFAVTTDEETLATLSPQRVADFSPQGETVTVPAVQFPEGITVQSSFAIDAADPIAIEGLPDGTVLILDQQQPFSTLQRYRFATLIGVPYSLQAFAAVIPDDEGGASPLDSSSSSSSSGSVSPFQLVGLDLVFVWAKGGAGRVYVVAQVGDQAFALSATLPGDGSLVLAPLATYLPMRLFGGRGLEAAGGTAYYDFSSTGTWLPLVEQRRPRYLADATIVTRCFDGGVPDCVWHRLFLDMILPDETGVQISSRAANDPNDLAHGAWIPEPAPMVQRDDGSEIPFAPVVDKHTTCDLLFQNPVGRYLQLQLYIYGNRRASPRIRALRAYYPRFSYTTYLPAVYRDSDTTGFLERFLANPESFFTPIEDRIANVQILLDAAGTPPDATAWLISWFGICVDPAWEDFRRRLLIRNAMTLFQWRGTPRGLQMALELLLNPCPDDTIFTRNEDATPGGIRILEGYALRRTAGLVPPAAPPAGGIVVTTQVAQWNPSLGGAILLASYNKLLQESSLTEVQAFPIVAPSDATTAAAWTTFTQQALGFVPAAPGPQDLYAWPGFLRRRYRRLSALNASYGASPAYASWQAVPLPTSLPPDGVELLDWFQFQGVVMPIRSVAHRFTVMLPVPVSAIGDVAAQATQASLAQRMIDLEKPAHTLYSVQFYWAMFRVGQVRLGIDTTMDRGSRSPELMPAMVVGQGFLSEAHLAPAPPQSATDRTILGRDRLRQGQD